MQANGDLIFEVTENLMCDGFNILRCRSRGVSLLPLDGGVADRCRCC